MMRPRWSLPALLAALLLSGCSGQVQSGSQTQSSSQAQPTNAAQNPAAQTTTAQTTTAQTTATLTTATQRRSTTTQTVPLQTGRDPASGLEWVPLSTLPHEAQTTYRLILAGGLFPYARDGVVFQNREGVLPRRSRGTYHEYTVKTPGSSDRGARRIVCAAVPECYYTGDHYASFRRVAGGRP